ncbi:MAG: zinc-dependent peptidase [Verrucomicrobia subdivision 3 bacterium]|nr:zinc-dependent peptidase [Limisphaerales bacterium]
MNRIFPWGQQARRERLLQQPWPKAWEDTLSETAHACLLSAEQLRKWRGIIRVLIAEKKWDGCDGVEITDTIKVTIASQAALMLLQMPHDYFGSVCSIVVFPSEFELLQEEWQERPDTALGQAPQGAVLLAWDVVSAEGRELSSGKNLVIHEFAHHLDFQDGFWNGCPELPDKWQRTRWHKAMTAAFMQVQRNLRKDRNTFFGDNAATNATEFFPEASERFFTFR